MEVTRKMFYVGSSFMYFHCTFAAIIFFWLSSSLPTFMSLIINIERENSSWVHSYNRGEGGKSFSYSGEFSVPTIPKNN